MSSGSESIIVEEPEPDQSDVPSSQEVQDEIANVSANRRKSLMQEIQKVHRGLCHPRNDNLLRILRRGRASPLIIALAKEFRCSVRIEHKQPKPWRRAAPPRQLSFNQVVGVDTPTLRHFDKSVHCLNIVHWGTRFQQIIPINSKHASSIRQAYRGWVKMFGAPRVIQILEKSFGVSLRNAVPLMVAWSNNLVSKRLRRQP